MRRKKKHEIDEDVGSDALKVIDRRPSSFHSPANDEEAGEDN